MARLRLLLILTVGIAAVVATYNWNNHQMHSTAKAISLALEANSRAHSGSIDAAIELIGSALELRPKDSSLYYDASGIYSVKGMTVFVAGGAEHVTWFEKSVEAAARADEFSDDWFYTRDHADSMLLAHFYGVEVDLPTVLDLYESVEFKNELLETRITAVTRMILALRMDEGDG